MAASNEPEALTPDQVEKILQEELPPELRSPQDFDAWYEPIRVDVVTATARVREEVESALAAERDRVCQEENKPRRVWELSGDEGGRSLLKSTGSVRDKLAREIAGRRGQAGYTAGGYSIPQVRNLLLAFNDLGRFRVTCDFSLDVHRAIRRVLGAEPDVLGGRGPGRLLDQYPMQGPLKDSVNLVRRRRPGQGHRAVQFSVRVDEGAGSYLVELQFMTLLQQAWDQRNHPLYEWTRTGGDLPDRLVLSDVALSELLYLADEQASANWVAFLKIRRETR